MKRNYLSQSSWQTKILGKKLAQAILISRPRQKKAFVIALQGELGGGKTTFLQGFAKGLGTKEKILSPTFVILKKFQIPKQKKQQVIFNLFYHLDCYRIQKSKEVLDLNFREIAGDKRNIIAIEWPEKIKNLIPENGVWVRFRFKNKEKRNIEISNFKPQILGKN